MKTTELKMLVASAWLFTTASASALQPQLLYGFQAVGSSSSTNANGANPRAALVLGSDGNFYGTTSQGGSNGYGTVFKVTTNGVLNTLVSFAGTNGAYPKSELLLSRDGDFYGTTPDGGSGNYGTIFKVTTNGMLTLLVSFADTNGVNPQAALTLGNDGNFYGTTSEAGGGRGTVFQLTMNGVFTSLVSFAYTNGSSPRAKLLLGGDGNFYGTTATGSRNFKFLGDPATVFKVTTNGVLTRLASLESLSNPLGGLVIGNDGDFYGTTSGGGDGMVFKVTTNGILTFLSSFTGENGTFPRGLVLGHNGNFYGTTEQGGSNGNGTVFRVTHGGEITSLVSFDYLNGARPDAGLVLGNDGYFYGTTSSGGPGGGGTIFRLVISVLTSVARRPDGSVLLTGTGPAHGSYRLWTSADLSLPLASWTQLTSASFDSNGNFGYADAGAVSNTSRFYQLSVP